MRQPLNYRVEEYEDGVLVFGAHPIDVMVRLSKRFPKGVIDTDLARLAGANLAMGTRDGCRRLRDNYIPRYRMQVVERYRHFALSAAALEWLVTGEQGESSLAMFHHLTRTPSMDGRVRSAHPHDPDDLRRCRLLLETVPELALRVKDMASLSREWAAIADKWEPLCRDMDVEAPQWRMGKGNAATTYAQIRALVETGVEP